MAQFIPLNFARDVQGVPANCPSFPLAIWTATLAAGSATSIAIPGSVKDSYIMFVRVQPNGWCWVSNTGTASVPAGSTLQADSSEIISGTIEYRRRVLGGSTVSFITPNTTCDIEVALYSNSGFQ